ncbi:MAG TPA: hypothetical protein VIY48_05975 [Candidatus Paceibacterota bacterium]
MMFMNHWDIDEAVARPTFFSYQHLAARFLQEFRNEVDANSDGWAYWKAPVMAAQKMQGIVLGKVEATESNYKAALTPIKRFYSLRGNAAGMKFPEV